MSSTSLLTSSLLYIIEHRQMPTEKEHSNVAEKAWSSLTKLLINSNPCLRFHHFNGSSAAIDIKMGIPAIWLCFLSLFSRSAKGTTLFMPTSICCGIVMEKFSLFLQKHKGEEKKLFYWINQWMRRAFIVIIKKYFSLITLSAISILFPFISFHFIFEGEWKKFFFVW